MHVFNVAFDHFNASLGNVIGACILKSKPHVFFFTKENRP